MMISTPGTPELDNILSGPMFAFVKLNGENVYMHVHTMA
jgi:hypothetical protein